MEPQPQAAAPAPAGAFTAGGLLLQTLRVWSRNALAFTAVAALVELPLLALGLRSGKAGVVSPLGAVFLWAMNVVAVAALSHGVLRWFAGERAGIGSMLGMLSSRLWPVFAVSAVYWLFVLVAAFPGIPLIIPGVLVFVMGFVSVPAVLARPELGPLGALLKSARLTQGHRMALFWAVLVIFGAYFVVLFGMQALIEHVPALPFAAAQASFSAVDALLTAMTGPCAAVAYQQLEAIAPPEAESSEF